MQIDIIITVILFVVALLRPQSKGVAVLIFALMWSLWGWNTWNGDYEAYAEIFINPNFATSELGYTILNKFIGLFTDDYQVFVIIISFMLLSSILLFIVRLSPYPALFSVIYFVIYLEEFVFIRNYILSTLLLVSIWITYNKEDVKCYVLAVLLGSAIHVFSLTYLLLLPAFYIKRISVRRVIRYIIPSVLLMIFASQFILPLFGQYVTDKVSYYTGGNSIITTSSYALIILVIIIDYVVKKVWKSRNCAPDLIKLIYGINIMSLVFVGVFSVIPYAASRFLRFIFIIDILFFTIALKEPVRRKNNVIIPFIIFILMILLFFISGRTMYPYTIIPLYLCNLLWGNEYYIPVIDL